MGRWNNETTLKFVTAYVQMECLWNTNSPLYKNKALKADAIYELEQTMGIPGFTHKEIKIKIKSIRSTYCQEIKKIKESEVSGAYVPYVYVPNIKWFAILHKCLHNLKPDIDTTCESNLKTEEVLAWEFPDDFTEGRTEINPTKPNLVERKSVKRKRESQKSLEHYEHREQQESQDVHDINKMAPNINKLTEPGNSSLRDDEFDVFGRLIAVQLKSLPLILALEAQGNIQSLLTKIRRKHLMQCSSTHNGIETTKSYAASDDNYRSE